MHQRYRRARRRERTPLRPEVCRVTGCPRTDALRPLHGPRVTPVLAALWAAAGSPRSGRLQTLLPLGLPWARPRVRRRSARPPPPLERRGASGGAIRPRVAARVAPRVRRDPFQRAQPLAQSLARISRVARARAPPTVADGGPVVGPPRIPSHLAR